MKLTVDYNYINTDGPVLTAIKYPTDPKPLDEIYKDKGTPHWKATAYELKTSDMDNAHNDIKEYLKGMNLCLYNVYSILNTIANNHDQVVLINGNEKDVTNRFDEIVEMLNDAIGRNDSDGVWGNAEANKVEIQNRAASYASNNTESCEPYPVITGYDNNGNPITKWYHKCVSHGAREAESCRFEQ